MLGYNLYITILKILEDFISILRKIQFCYWKYHVLEKLMSSFSPKDIKEDFFYLNLHKILHHLMPNLLVLYLILGSMLNLPLADSLSEGNPGNFVQLSDDLREGYVNELHENKSEDDGGTEWGLEDNSGPWGRFQ